MKKTFLFAAALLLGAGVSLSAQETSQSDNLPMYQRSSLHMILLRTDEPLLADGQDFSSLITEAWSNYPFPDKYNQHAILFTEAYGGAPKGSLMEILHTFRGKKVEDWGIDDVVLLQQKLSKNKEYNDQLVAATQGIISDQKIGNQLMNIELTGLLHNSLTYAQKARPLKKGEEKLAEITNDPIERGSFFGNLVSTAYGLINHMTDNAVQDHADKYKAGLDPNNQDVELEPLGNYFIDIMNIVAAMYSPDGKASFNIEMLEGVDLPTWAGDLT